MHKLHSLLVTTYLIAGLALMGTADWPALTGMVVDTTLQTAPEAAKTAAASMQLFLGVALFTLGGFVHAYAVSRNERNVPVRGVTTPKTLREKTVFWLEMKV